MRQVRPAQRSATAKVSRCSLLTSTDDGQNTVRNHPTIDCVTHLAPRSAAMAEVLDPTGMPTCLGIVRGAGPVWDKGHESHQDERKARHRACSPLEAERPSSTRVPRHRPTRVVLGTERRSDPSTRGNTASHSGPLGQERYKGASIPKASTQGPSPPDALVHLRASSALVVVRFDRRMYEVTPHGERGRRRARRGEALENG